MTIWDHSIRYHLWDGCCNCVVIQSGRLRTLAEVVKKGGSGAEEEVGK